ncbi:F0F1 ATP synthase subunit B [Paenibacillus shunpengii]|uniref:ATP synthase subunit b n=1 Tax=Paenibacillus shunpengii TaxID=2054424 RepID=A0ABW5SXD4_9BACL
MSILWENIAITIVAFLILYFLLSKFAFNKLFGIMEQRRELVAKQMEDAKQTREQAIQYVEEQKAALQEARQEAQGIIEQSRKTSASQAEALLIEAKQQTERMKDEAVREIESEKNKAVASLRNELGTVSVQIASKILDKEVKQDKAQEELVEKYLNEVGGRP